MNLLLRYTIIISVYFVPCHSYAQGDSTRLLSISGIVKDSARNYLIRDATVAIYSTSDTSLIRYQLSNQIGRFKLEGLPDHKKLKIVISYAGYKPYDHIIDISGNSNTYDLGYINLVDGSDLENIVVKSLLPVRMNGDTLEFNADAFKLDKGAVAEDLLRRLPGVILWGDGTITVNGRNVHVVYVDGKRFFGDDAKLATQNIPKEALDKVQVYQQNKNPDNPYDSTTVINLKLKENKRVGYFGKLSAGVGTSKTHDFDINMNAFTRRMQLAIIGALNNTNKIAKSVDDLLINSTFKSRSFDYKPDLTLNGITQSKSSGLTFSYDFKKNADSREGSQNLLKVKSFLNDQQKILDENISSITTVGGDSTLEYKTLNRNQSSSRLNIVNGIYIYQKSNLYFDIRPSYQELKQNNRSQVSQLVASNINGVVSENSNRLDNSSTSNKLDIETKLSADLSQTKAAAKQIVINYKVSRGNTKNISNISNEFTSYIPDSQIILTARNYDIETQGTDQELNVSFLDFGNLFRNSKWFSSFQYNLVNGLKIKDELRNQVVFDILSGSKNENFNLSNRNTYQYIEYTPGVSIGKNYIRSIADRYRKSLSINSEFKYQLFYQGNRSENSLLSFVKHYSNFVPTLNVNFLNEQYGRFKREIVFSYRTNVEYPELEQLYPLVDSINPYFIRIGNSALSQSVERSLNVRFQYSGLRRNAINAGFNLIAGTTKNALTDSTILLNDGGVVQYTVNSNAFQHYLLTANLSKNFDLSNSNKLQLMLRPALDYSRRPAYLQSATQTIFNVSPILRITNNISVYYNHKEHFYLSMLFEHQSYVRYKDRLSSNNLYTNLKRLSLISGVDILKSINLSSDLSYSNLKFNRNQKTEFFLLNISLEHRFFSGKNLSLKFLAFDILRQNKSFVTRASPFSVTTEQRNVLQNYYMLTLSYYPRQFGKKR